MEWNQLKKMEVISFHWDAAVSFAKSKKRDGTLKIRMVASTIFSSHFQDSFGKHIILLRAGCLQLQHHFLFFILFLQIQYLPPL